ncbi:MAG TPA: CDP-alcohol phosphatidyltransferase family protein [Frankiaceae bacterium]|nr:CDP-alcohol phosphatidyltransferase family protein [Frankiaceae bacterium]
MDGLYALKPWYARRLRPVRTALVARRVPPHALTAAGVAAAAAGGVALATGHGLAVLPLVAARLAFANLDGAVARESGRATPGGSVVNELGDRLADAALLAGAVALAPPALVLGAVLAATMPSWVALAGAAAGAPRVNGGPVGKTERCALVCLAALAPATTQAVLWAVVAGSLATATLRLSRVARALRPAATASAR